MYNYFTDTIISVDIYLAFVLLLMAATILLYIMASDREDARRKRALLTIKRNVYELILSGNAGKTAAPALDFTPQQFIDVETNRMKEAVFFNKAEQEAFKSSFVTPEKIAKVAAIARMSGDKWRRIEAIMSLGYMRATSEVPALQKALFSRDEDVSYFSMVALGHIRSAAAAKALLEFLKKNVPARRKVVSLLEGFDDAAPEAAMMLKDRDAQVRFWALKLLSKLKPEKYLKAIEPMSEDKSDDVRAAACECLGASGKAEVKDILVRSLKDASWMVRAAAIRALSDLLDDKCIHYILDMINDGSLSVLSALTDVMARHIGAARPFIEKAMKGDDPIAKRIAAEASGLAGYMTNKPEGQK